MQKEYSFKSKRNATSNPVMNLGGLYHLLYTEWAIELNGPCALQDWALFLFCKPRSTGVSELQRGPQDESGEKPTEISVSNEGSSSLPSVGVRIVTPGKVGVKHSKDSPGHIIDVFIRNASMPFEILYASEV